MLPTIVLRAGAARVEIPLPPALFPIEGFTGLHDPLHARVLLLESGAPGALTRIAIASLELTSLPQEKVASLQQAISRACALPPENVLVTVTHTFSAPHFAPPQALNTPADLHKNALLEQAVTSAVQQASALAVSNMQDARLGCGAGCCDVNVNRDVPTAEGWWLGCSEDGPADKQVLVFRFDALDGGPIALLFSYAVQSSVMDGSQLRGGVRPVTSDLAGAAMRFMERRFDDALTAIFCIGAAGDQAPALKARFQYADKDGALQVEDVGEQGFVIAELLGKRLGGEALRVARATECTPLEQPISLERFVVSCPGQQMTHDIHSLRPTHRFDFLPAQDRPEPVVILRLGQAALVGVRPELGCRTAAAIQAQSPYAITGILTMVNGGAKYMADQRSYDRITYEAMNSPFARGGAELLAGEIIERLRRPGLINSSLE